MFTAFFSLLGSQAGIAAAQCHTVGFADNGASDDFDRKFQLPVHFPDDGNLLKIFFSEIGTVGFYRIEEFAHDLSHAR